MAAYEPVNSALKCLSVLREVSIRGNASVQAIQGALNLNRSTVIRMLETLTYAGLVARDKLSGAYVVTGKSLELSMGFQLDNVVAMAAAPVLDDLQRKIGWPSDVAIFDEDAMIVVATNRRNETKFFHDRRPGFRTPLLGSALGRAYIAFTNEEERALAIEALRYHSEPWNSSVRKAVQVSDLVTIIKNQGYATTEHSYAKHAYNGSVNSIGVPVLDGSQPIAALNVTYLRDTLTLEEALGRLLMPLQHASQLLSRNILQSQSTSSHA